MYTEIDVRQSRGDKQEVHATRANLESKDTTFDNIINSSSNTTQCVHSNKEPEIEKPVSKPDPNSGNDLFRLASPKNHPPDRIVPHTKLTC